MNRNIERRLSAIEAVHRVEAPTSILSDRPMSDEEGGEALANWRGIVGRGEASISGTVLCIIGAPLTEAEWEWLHATEH